MKDDLSVSVKVGERHRAYLNELSNSAEKKSGRPVPLRDVLASVIEFCMEAERGRKPRPKRGHQDRHIRGT